jgi:3-deoxy-D-manno-octulosonate 8-phosphate phosphatase (KDO 8-P phosphatase)
VTLSAELRRQLERVRLLVTDVDGVLTDGTLYYGERGEVMKAFHVRDGLAVKLLARAGVEVAVISGRSSEPLARRMAELGVKMLLTGRDDKARALAEVLALAGVPGEDAAYVGDDVIDLPALRRAGLAISVADAHPLVRAEADWVTEAAGGRGALREIADAILDCGEGLTASVEALLAEARQR